MRFIFLFLLLGISSIFLINLAYALETNHESFDLSTSDSIDLVIMGNLNNFQSSTRLILTIIFPDGSDSDYDVRVNGKGAFSKTFTLTNNWQYGKYVVNGNYGDVNLGTTSFVIEEPYDPRIGMKTSSEPVESVEEFIETTPKIIENSIESSEQTNVESMKENYPVNMKIKMPKLNYEYGETIIIELEFDKVVKNTPISILINSDNFFIENYEIIPKKVETQEGLLGITSLNELDDNWRFKETGIFKLLLKMRDLPTDKYDITAIFGSGDTILGKTTQQFSYTNNDSSVGKEIIKKYFPTVLDIGTNFEINPYPSKHYLVNKKLDPCFNYDCKTSVSQDYSVRERSSLKQYQLFLHEFYTVEDAKTYATSHWEWNGVPSSKGNKFAVISPNKINSDSKQCFEFKGVYSSANGVDGLLKCTNGRFVVEVSNKSENGHDLVNAIIEKIDSSNIDVSSNLKIPILTESEIHENSSSKPALEILDKAKIPDWVKNTMQWYLDGVISEDEMISAISFW